MKIIYANTSLEEIENIRRNALLDEPGTMCETTKLAVRSFPLLLLYILNAYIILFKVFSSQPLCFNTIIGKIMQWKSFINAGIASKSVILCWATLGYLSVIGVMLYTVVIIIGKIYKSTVYKLFPIKTPYTEQNKRNRVFYDQTECIETSIKQQNELRNFLDNEEAAFTLNNDELEITKQRECYCEKHTFKLSANLREGIQKNNTLDFTYLDDDWQKALSEKQGYFNRTLLEGK